MKRVVLALMLLGLAVPALRAQNVLIGEKAPEIKSATWLEGRQPRPAPLTYIEFYHSTQPNGDESLAHLERLARKLGTKLRVVVVTNEKKESFAAVLLPYVTRNGNFGVILDGGRIFTAYGVSYLPFGVLVDAKNRALWLGNSLNLKEEILVNSTK